MGINDGIANSIVSEANRFLINYKTIYTAQFHLYIYLTIADVLDVLSLINCYVGFTVSSAFSEFHLFSEKL
ncbi:unnamed protein product [Onchocerca flexuosa]|uniref:Ovule protein n=1 Tax=Onchocerca flexuosa TaxID=387005 RepID=A0A183HLA2_9BILA|nr:unnamed protein product [Onchocerca flexuosa]